MSAIRLTGRLVTDARACTATDGTAWLIVQIGQGSGSLAAEARHRLGQGPGAQHICAGAARHLRAGTKVCVHAQGWDVLRTPVPHLVLRGVELIEHLELAPPRSDATARATRELQP